MTGGADAISSIMACEGFRDPVENRFPDPLSGIGQPPGIPVLFLALARGDDGIGRGPGQREVQCLQGLGFCLGRDHDRFEKCCIFHPLAAGDDNIDGPCIRRGFAADSCRDENRDKIILEHAALLQGTVVNRPK